MMSYEVELENEGEVIRSAELDTPKEIAEHFDLEDKEAQIAEVCRWADEMGCAQGLATGPAESLIIFTI